MRGKHAASATGRREVAELEERADAAEQRAGRLAAELDSLREKAEHQLDSLRAELSRARKDRDAAAAPAVAAAEEKIRTLMVERDEARADAKDIRGKWDAFIRNIKDVLHGMGLGSFEAVEVILAAVRPDGSTTTVSNTPRRKGATVDRIMAVERARGQRGPVDLLAGRKNSA